MVRILAAAFLGVLILSTPLWAGYYGSYGYSHHAGYNGGGYHGGGCGGGGGGYDNHHGYMHDGDGYYPGYGPSTEYRTWSRSESRYYSERDRSDRGDFGYNHH